MSLNSKLVEELIAEIKRDIDINNLLALRELLSKLLQNKETRSMLINFLSEFPELREKYKDKKLYESEWKKMHELLEKQIELS